MAWYDRDYHREEMAGGGGLMSRLGKHSVVTWLLGINGVVFVIDSIFRAATNAGGFVPVVWGAFTVEHGLFGLQLWRWFTYQFFHWDFFHLLFNMIGLFFFGPMIEQWWGSRRFLAFYLICGATGALLMTLLSFIPGPFGIGPGSALVGASGSLYGILIAAAVLYPHQRVMLIIPPIPMKMRTMALIFLGLSFFSLALGANAGGQAAHLGGAAMGYVLVKHPWALNWADRVSFDRWREGRQRRQRDRQRQRMAAEEAEVDRILDKVRDHGLQSLTRREKKILSKATDRHRRAG